MKSLIVYCSSHGTTTRVALLLRRQIEGDVVVLNLKRAKLLSDLEIFDSVIIGGSIHIGKIQGRVKKFIKENHETLKTREVGLFLCCMREGEVAKQQFESAFPGDLRVNAIAKGMFGGEFLITKMNFLEKKIVKTISGVTTDTFKIDEDAIRKFAVTFNNKNKAKLTVPKIGSKSQYRTSNLRSI